MHTENIKLLYNQKDKKLASAIYGELIKLLSVKDIDKYSLGYVRGLIELEKYVVHNKKPHSSSIEDKLLDFFTYFVIDYDDGIIEEGVVLK